MADLVFTDTYIQHLLLMPKVVQNPGARWREQNFSSQRNFSLLGSPGEIEFLLYQRQNMRADDHFSCGLVLIHSSGTKVHLTRYNGSDHPHGNRLEEEEFPRSCHIHIATERYMAAGMKPESYAVMTTEYSTIEGAMLCLLRNCNILGFDLTGGDDDEHDDGTENQFRLL